MVATPWHQDIPYYFVDGDQTVSFWIPLTKMDKEFSLRCAIGSHKLSKYVRPTSWSSNQNFYKDSNLFMDLPDMDGGNFEIMQWSMSPGDAIAFNYKLIHSAGANTTDNETQTLSMRVIGDDVCYIERPGKTSPHYDNLNQKNGDRLREDWFPFIYKS
jgi:ectoine hydroxylase-related dioxygenase (phytanoyl-CoA dioxygenase family)